MKKKKELSTEALSQETLLENLISDYTTTKQQMVMQLKHEKIDQDAFLEDVERHIHTYYTAEEETKEAVRKLFKEYIFGYFRLTSLIDDPEVSDIRCLAYDNIRVKRKGIRSDSGVKFHSPEEYRSFVDMVATKNQVSISNMNAIQRFTDTKSNPDYILRFTVCMPLVNTYEVPYLSIRKVPRNFPEINDLIKAGMMNQETADMLVNRFRNGSTLVCGGNSSGKTTILNALKEMILENKSVLVTQQADELTTKNHPDMMFLHSLPGTAESQVSYDLKDISIAGLTMDVDYFIVGEVKGDEAIYLLNAAYTGQICAATIHAPSAQKAADKLVDYCMYESRYSRNELMKMMSCFDTVVFMSGYRVQQVYEVGEWNPATGDLIYKKLL